jgi:hypothetical protein
MDRRIFRDLCILIAVIIIAAIGARILAKGETLEDYAQKNPSAAGIPAVSNISASASQIVSTQQQPSEKETEFSEEKPQELETKPVDQDNGTDDSAENNKNIVYYAEGFYYEPISDEIFKRIAGISYPTDCTIELSDLRYVTLQYNDFNGNTQSGEMICASSIAQDVVEIFYELYTNGYQIESIKLIDEFGGDDTSSMLANNTSCFNYRVVEGTTRLSNHAKGLAIDLNPFYNPYITYNQDGSVNISPKGSEAYADRSGAFPYKIDESDLAYKLFKEHGFTWGGNWNSVKDYQHFERPN